MTDTFRRPRRPLTERQRKEALLALLRTDQHAITNALRTHARRMGDAAQQAQAGFAAGQADRDVKSAQDNTILTNNGYKQSGSLFATEAAKATRIADEIDLLLDGSEDD